MSEYDEMLANQWDLARADLKKVLELDPSHKGAISSLDAVNSLEKIL